MLGRKEQSSTMVSSRADFGITQHVSWTSPSFDFSTTMTERDASDARGYVCRLSFFEVAEQTRRISLAGFRRVSSAGKSRTWVHTDVILFFDETG